VWRVVAAAEAAGIKRKLCMEKKVWGSRKGHDRQVSTASVRRSKTQMLGRATQVFPHVTAKSLAAGLQSCARISATDLMPSPRISYLPEPLCTQTDRQTGGYMFTLLSTMWRALSLSFSLCCCFVGYWISILPLVHRHHQCYLLINPFLAWRNMKRKKKKTRVLSINTGHESSASWNNIWGWKVPLITLDNRFQLHYKDAGHFHLKLCPDASHFHLNLCFGSGLDNRFELYYKDKVQKLSCRPLPS
jgi:hypothetical protein